MISDKFIEILYKEVKNPYLDPLKFKIYGRLYETGEPYFIVREMSKKAKISIKQLIIQHLIFAKNNKRNYKK